MIAVKLMGGIGNQMFQYAAARSLALEKKTWVYLDPSFLYQDSKGQWTQRDYALDAFNIQYKFERSGRINMLRRLNHKSLWRKLSDSRFWPFSFRNYNEPGLQFHPELFDYPKNTYLEGYFQSEQYFQKHAATIRKDFTFAQDVEGKNKETLEKIRGTFSISVHVRRGDYVTLASAREYHGLPGLEYYNAGVQCILQDKTESPEFFVFSDEPDWVKQNLVLPGPSTYVDWNSGAASFEDMRLMSNCRHHIIANSSFSWWGAWLNDANDKIVIAPRKWFNKPGMNDSDLVPDSWIRL